MTVWGAPQGCFNDWKRVKARRQLPQPVVINGIRYWFADEIEAAMANLSRGQGTKPFAALNGRARQIAQARAAKAGKANAGAPLNQMQIGIATVTS